MERTRLILFLKYLGYSVGPLLVLLLMGVGLIFLNQRYSRANAETVVSRSLEQVHTRMDLVFGELESLAIALSSDRRLLNSASSILNQPRLTYDSWRNLRLITGSLNSSVYSRPYLSSIYIYVQNDYERKISTERPFSPLRPERDPDWLDSYLGHIAGKPSEFTGPWNTVREVRNNLPWAESEDVVTLYRSTSSGGQLGSQGVIALNADLAYLEELVRSALVFPEQLVLISDGSDNKLLVSANEPTGYDAGPLGEAVFGRPSGNGIVDVSGEVFFLTGTHGSEGNWQYVSLVPLNVVYSIPRQLQLVSSLFLLVSAIVAVWITIWLSRRSFLQIGRLVDVIEYLDTQNLLPASEFARQRSELTEHLSYSVMRDFVEKKLVPVKASEKKYRRRTLELLAMQSQISPHFLHNTIETLIWKSCEATGGRNEVTETLEELADILDYALSQDGNLRTLGDELRYTREYLSIQKRRRSEPLSIHWNIDDDLVDARILPMVLLSLVENSLQHGFEYPSSDDALTIGARAVGDDRLRVSVRDNGKGMDSGAVIALTRSLKSEDQRHDHIGLFNSNKRIELAFGRDWGLEIESEYGVFTEVSAEMPLKF